MNAVSKASIHMCEEKSNQGFQLNWDPTTKDKKLSGIKPFKKKNSNIEVIIKSLKSTIKKETILYILFGLNNLF